MGRENRAERDALRRLLTEMPHLDFAAFLNVVARQAADVVSAQQCSVGLIADGSGELVTVASLNVPPPRQTARFGRGMGVAGWVMATEQPALIGDVREDPRYARLAYPEVTSFLSVPLRRGQHLLGTLSVGKWEANAFDESDLATLQSYASLCGPAIYMAQVYKESLESQARLARDLRDADLARTNALLDVAHELKTPANSVGGILDIVLRRQAGELTEEQTELLATARSEVQRLLDAANRVLDLGAATLQPQVQKGAVYLPEVVQKCVRRVRPAARSRRVNFDVQLEEGLGSVAGHGQRLEQALDNVLANAVRHSPEGGTILVRARASDRGQTIQVEDEGPGIPADSLERVFERFFQAHRVLAPPSGEVGLGLAISRALVEQHGGRMRAEARETGGTRISMELPEA